MSNSKPPRNAFICGCGHTGTTLVATILSTHSEIFLPLVETGIFIEENERLARRRLGLLRNAVEENGKSVLVEKTPRHVRHLDKIRRLAPGARLILMVRDGRDVAASIGKRQGGSFEIGLRRWVRDCALVAAQLSHPDVYLLRYEDLVVDLEAHVAALCLHLGIEYEPAMLDYHKTPHLWFGRKEVRDANTHEEHRNWQVNQPVFDGRGRWKTDLPAEFVAHFKTGPAAELMRLFGYAEGGAAIASGPRGRDAA